MKDFLGMKDERLITFVSEVSESELFCPASFIFYLLAKRSFSAKRGPNIHFPRLHRRPHIVHSQDVCTPL